MVDKLTRGGKGQLAMDAYTLVDLKKENNIPCWIYYPENEHLSSDVVDNLDLSIVV